MGAKDNDVACEAEDKGQLAKGCRGALGFGCFWGRGFGGFEDGGGFRQATKPRTMQDDVEVVADVTEAGRGTWSAGFRFGGSG